MQALHLVNTVWIMVLPGAFTFWNIAVVRASITSIPTDLFDAARVDGANDVWILLKIVVPLTKPTLAVIALFAAVARWNDYFTPLIFLQDSHMFPLSIILRRVLVDKSTGDLAAGAYAAGETSLLAQEGSLRALRMAAIIATSGPILLIYPFVQNISRKACFWDR